MLVKFISVFISFDLFRDVVEQIFFRSHLSFSYSGLMLVGVDDGLETRMTIESVIGSLVIKLML